MTRILVATRAGLVVVADGTTERCLVDLDPECVTVAGDAWLVGTLDDGLWRSEDDGETWIRVGRERFPDRVTAVAAGGREGEAWVGTEPSRVARSTDAGRSWADRPGLTDLDSADGWAFPPRPHTHHVRWLQPRPDDPDALYVAVEAGALVRTPDAGATWRDRVPSGPRDTHTMAVHPDRPGWAASAAGDGYVETTDGGETWEHREEGLAHTYCWSVAVGADPALRVLSAARSARQAHRVGESYVYRRTGRGDASAWERVDGLPTGEGVYRPVLVADDGGFLAASNRGLFRSPDGGDWERLVAAGALPDGPVRGLAVA